MMRDVINRICDRAKLLKAWADNHPAAVELASYVHTDEAPTVVFQGKALGRVIEAVGAEGWRLRASYRGDTNDLFRWQDGVLLIVRDAELSATAGATINFHATHDFHS